MDPLDRMVTETITARLMQPERIAGLLPALSRQRAEEASVVESVSAASNMRRVRLRNG